MLIKSMSPAFVLSKTSLSLPEVQWAFENGVIGAQLVVDMASVMVADGMDSEQLVRLAGLSHAELSEVKDILTGCFEGDSDVTRAKWLWLVLSWVYEQEQDGDGVFDTIDELYADFGYPAEMVSFGPYSPAYQGKREPVEARQEVLRAWRQYLDRGNESFGRR